jgi:uncharacterized membrane protein YjjP (DUF1212 family)
VSQQDRVAFVLGLARAMHASGYAAHRLEDVLVAAAQRLGLEAQFFATPTSIFASFGVGEAERTFLLRVEPADVDLSRLSQLDRVLTRVLGGEVTPSDGARAIERIRSLPPRYGGFITALACGVASAAAGRFLGGGLLEIAVAAVIGLSTGLLAAITRRAAGFRRIFELVAAFTGAAIAATTSIVVAPHSVFVATLAGLIVLVPGFTLTVAMNELATRHLVSGTARLSGAILVFLAIIFGVAIGNSLVGTLLGQPVIVEPLALPLWTELAALLLAPLGFGILLRAEPRDLGWVLLAGWLAYGGARLGSMALGADLGVFVGALAVGVGSSMFGWLLDRPPQIPLTPGVLMLVPGSVGYRSLAALLDRQVISGIETAFTMVLMATALVSGLLVANVLVPRRRVSG